MKKYDPSSNLNKYFRMHEQCLHAYLDANEFTSKLDRRFDGRKQLDHPVSVADTVSTLFPKNKKRTAKLITTALLHDLIEDANVDYSYIKNTYGKNIAQSVHTLTHAPHLSKTGRKGEILLQAMLKMDDDTLIVKLADRLDNIETLYAMPKQKINQTLIDTDVILNGLIKNKKNLTTQQKDLIDVISINMERYEKNR